jgi:hypothetical protein
MFRPVGWGTVVTSSAKHVFALSLVILPHFPVLSRAESLSVHV